MTVPRKITTQHTEREPGTRYTNTTEVHKTDSIHKLEPMSRSTALTPFLPGHHTTAMDDRPLQPAGLRRRASFEPDQPMPPPPIYVGPRPPPAPPSDSDWSFPRRVRDNHVRTNATASLICGIIFRSPCRAVRYRSPCRAVQHLGCL